jgi:hydroxyethylthiazole kinase-like uncharacterized protein yjeF
MDIQTKEKRVQRVFEDCYAMDRRCYEEYGLTEDILMEHAAEGIAGYIRTHFDVGSSVMIIGGPGNNGADGIVLSRLLFAAYTVRLMLPMGAKSAMAKLQLERAGKLGIELCESMQDADVVVDALFGAGLNRKLDEKSRLLVKEMNRLRGFKIACDIPSGIGRRGELLPLAFRADLTITMGALKASLYLDEAKEYVGEILCADLGVERSLYEMESDTFLLEREEMKLPLRKNKVSHKGTFGHAVLLCGEKEGAAIIAGSAASRFGAGLTTLVIHERIVAPAYLMVSTVVPETGTALAVGMGLGSYFEKEFLDRHVIGSTLPLILDADSFYSRELLSVLERRDRKVVLTPHPKEFVSLWSIMMGENLTVPQVQKRRFELARTFSARFPSAVLLLKGANMLIAHQGKIWINAFGSSMLSKGGSGDVLSGLIVALLAQGYEPLDAAISGSLALTEAAYRYDGANYSMLPTDLVDEIGKLS